MERQRCKDCRWFVRSDKAEDKFGECRRFPPLHSQNTAWLAVQPAEWCGEWADNSGTAEEVKRRDLIRQFAVALVASGSEAMVHQVWQRAAEFADYEGQT